MRTIRPDTKTRHALAFIAITLLLDTVGFGLIMPVYPRLLVELTGQSLSRAAVYGGWQGFVYAAMQFVCAPVLGNLSDRFGRRRVVLFAVGALGVDYIIIMGVAHLFARFRAADAPLHLPAAAFITAGILAVGSLVIFWFSTRETVAEPIARTANELTAA